MPATPCEVALGRQPGRIKLDDLLDLVVKEAAEAHASSEARAIAAVEMAFRGLSCEALAANMRSHDLAGLRVRALPPSPRPRQDRPAMSAAAELDHVGLAEALELVLLVG